MSVMSSWGLSVPSFRSSLLTFIDVLTALLGELGTIKIGVVCFHQRLYATFTRIEAPRYLAVLSRHLFHSWIRRWMIKKEFLELKFS